MNQGYELAMALRCAYLSLHRRANALFVPLGITADQFVLLTLLAAADKVSQKELAARSFSDPNTIRAMLVLLEGQNLVRREADPSDGRARKVILTAKGRKLQDRAWQVAAELHDEIEHFGAPPELGSLLRQLQRISLTVGTPPETRLVPAAKK